MFICEISIITVLICQKFIGPVQPKIKFLSPYLQFGYQKYRSSCSQMLFRIGVLKNVAMFPEKHLP